MRTLPLKSSASLPNKESMVFSSIDNRAVATTTVSRPFKSIQPDKSSTVNSFKENRNSQVFITSPYDHQVTHQVLHSPLHNHNNHHNNNYKHISTVFTTNHEKVVSSNRPTMGGKTISAIHRLPASTAIHSPNLMSFRELKALSRRINPHEPLSSPHASPTKPPLPNICLQSRKRAREQQLQRFASQKLLKTQHNSDSVIAAPAVAAVATVTEPTVKEEQKEEAVSTSTPLFSCEPCNKKYKTRNGLNYHLERCKFPLSKPTVTAPSIVTNAIIHCICSHPTDDINAMIECIECHTWLHLKCAAAQEDGDINESTYCCPRCTTTTTTTTTTNIKQEVLEEALVEELQEDEEEDDDDDEEEEETEDHLLQNGITVNLSELCQAKERGKNLLESFKQVEQQQEIARPIRNEFNFISLFSDETVFDTTIAATTTTTTTTTTTATEESATTAWGDSTNWTVPSLLFDHEQDPPSSSFIDESTSLLLSPQMDWLHFANFEVDFTASHQDDIVDDQ